MHEPTPIADPNFPRHRASTLSLLTLKKMPRDYAKEYKTYHGKQEQFKRRDARNKARTLMEKTGLLRKGDGLHVDHPKQNR